jgi:hypothetical protein
MKNNSPTAFRRRRKRSKNKSSLRGIFIFSIPLIHRRGSAQAQDPKKILKKCTPLKKTLFRRYVRNEKVTVFGVEFRERLWMQIKFL